MKIVKLPDSIQEELKQIKNDIHPIKADLEQYLFNNKKYDAFYDKAITNYYNEYNKGKNNKVNIYGLFFEKEDTYYIELWPEQQIKKRVIHKELIENSQYFESLNKLDKYGIKINKPSMYYNHFYQGDIKTHLFDILLEGEDSYFIIYEYYSTDKQ